jgi:hypothetical protein
MQAHLQENNTLVIPDIPVSMTASTPITSPYVNMTNADAIECILFLAVSVAGATSVGRIEILAASAANGTGAVPIGFKEVYKTIGATTIKQGTGKPVRLEQTAAGIPAKVLYFDTLAADGDKQQQYVIPVRARQLPELKPWVAIRFTAGAATARNGLFAFIRRDNVTGFDIQNTSIFA